MAILLGDIHLKMVKERLLQPDAQEKGWLLDGYPRSCSQAMALETLGIRPDIFILLDVPDEIIVQGVVGRRLDPVTGKIYHLKYSPAENDEIASRLTQRFDDTEEKHNNYQFQYSPSITAIIPAASQAPKLPSETVVKGIEETIRDQNNELLDRTAKFRKHATAIAE